MPRLAWFSPLPPARTGVAAYSAEVLPLVAREHDVDVFVDQPNPSGIPARDFVWMHLRAPYDLVVYQLGNSPAHDYMWGYLVRYPGLVVLHDAQLHHSRAKSLLSRGRVTEYRNELRFNHPDAPAGLAKLVAANLAGTLFYHWPMIGVAVRSARMVAVHSEQLRRDLAAEFVATPVELIRMGVADPKMSAVGIGPGATEVRTKLGLPPDGVLFVAFGGVTPEKRIRQAIRALAGIGRNHLHVRLLLVGEPAPYYDALKDARTYGVEDQVSLSGYVEDGAFASYLAAADVCLCMRWPTTRETSAAWLRCLAAGKATISTDLLQNDEAPFLDPRTWTTKGPVHSLGGAGAAGSREAVCVAIDILDEDHSLRLAMRRLARDAALRAALGRRARAWWEQTHTLVHMADDYRRVIARAHDAPAPDRSALPTHLRADGTQLTRTLIEAVGARADVLPWD